MEKTSGPSLEFATPVLPTLAIPQLVATAGIYPIKDSPGWGTNYLGMIQTFAGTSAYGAPPAQGQLLVLTSNTALFSLYGTFYGGDGTTSFALPDLSGRTAVGGAPGEEAAQTLAMTYMISALGPATGNEPPLGSVGLFGGNYAAPGWVACDGSLLSAAEFPDLAAVIGTTFGGDGTDFAVPNLSGRAAYGVGKGLGVPPVTLGQVVDGAVPGLGLNYIICTKGLHPSSDGVGEFPTEPFLAQVTAYAGAEPPGDWTLCDGALLNTEDYPALFSLIGTTYGGDGAETFALPDLRGKVTVGN